jgi:hypothetical protein
MELHLGKQHRLNKWPPSLGKVLARCHGIEFNERVLGYMVAVGLEAAAALLKQHPFIVVNVDPSDLPARLDALAAALGTDRKTILGLCTRIKGAAQMLQMRPERTAERVEALCHVMQLAPEQLLKKVAKHALVLSVDPAAVRRRAAALGEGLGLDTAGVVELCRRSPQCLMAASSKVGAVVEAVQMALKVPREEAVRLCLKWPAILHRSPASVKAKAEVLKQQLRLQGGDLGSYMVRPNLVAT